MKNYLKSGIVLSSICFVLAVLLAVCNNLTAPRILLEEKKETQNALFVVYEGAKSFSDPLNLTDYTGLPKNVKEAYRADDGGYVIKIEAKGLETGMIILCGVSPSGEVLGAKCLSSNETYGYEKTYGESFVGKDAAGVEEVDTISGATKTTAGYKNAIKDALGAAIVLGGGSYESRSNEEIMLDAALPSAEGAFEDVFFSEYVEGLTRVYKAKNASGYVLVLNGNYVGADTTGAVTYVVSGLDDAKVPVLEDKSVYADGLGETLNKVSSESDATALDLSAYAGLSSYIESVSKTEGGNYVVVIKANGYDAQSKYSPTKTPIKIKVSLTASGKIISTKTLEQNESEGYGAECASPDYYTKYNGKDGESYKNVDAISGATKTSEAYRNAIGKAIDAVKIIEGGDANNE